MDTFETFETYEATQFETPPPQKKRSPLLPILIIAAAVIAVAAIAVSIFLSSPLMLITRGIKNSADALSDNKIVSYAADLVKNGSVEVIADADALTRELLGFPMNGEAGIRMTHDMNKGVAVDIYADVATVELDLGIIADKKNIAIYSDSLLDGAYGFELENFVKDFEDSIFGPFGEYSLGLDLDDISINGDAEDLKEFTSLLIDSRKAVVRFAKTLGLSINKNTEFEKDRTKLQFAGESARVTAITATLNGRDFCNILGDAVEYIRDDKDLKELAYSYADYMKELDSASGRELESVIDDFYDTLDEVDDDALEDLADDLEDELDICLVFYINRSKELVGIDAELSVYGDDLYMSLLAGPTLKAVDEISFEMEEGNYYSCDLSYTVKSNDKDEYSARLKGREDGDEFLAGKVKYDKGDGDFSVELETDGGREVYDIEGSFITAKSSRIIRLESVSANGNSVEPGITLKTDTVAKLPSVPEYTNIFDLTAIEFENIVMDVEDVIYGITGALSLF